MNTKPLLCLIASALLCTLANAQTNNFVFSLSPDDKWEYDIFDNNDPWDTTHTTLRFTKDTVMPNRMTYKCFSTASYTLFYLRLDSSRLMQYSQRDSTEFPRYDFSKKTGDTVAIIRSTPYSTQYNILSSDHFQPVFGVSRRMLSFHGAGIWDDVVDSIGILNLAVGLEVYYMLTGAVVNGKSYGTVTGLHTDENPIPAGYALLQNYPNPFNPSTTISFDLTHKTYVFLRVANVLGQVVTTLVSEEKQAGSYKVVWNPSHLAGGVYYCSLYAGSIVETRKMLLLK